jgi:hypothetical protein
MKEKKNWNHLFCTHLHSSFFMANLHVFQRVSYLRAFHPEWVDGVPGAPGPVDPTMQRLLGFMVRDIAHEISSPELTKALHQLGRTVVIKNSSKGERSYGVTMFDDEPWPCGTDRWNWFINWLLHHKFPPPPPPPEHPDWNIAVNVVISDLMMAQSLQTVATLLNDRDLASQVVKASNQVVNQALEAAKNQFHL